MIPLPLIVILMSRRPHLGVGYHGCSIEAAHTRTAGADQHAPFSTRCPISKPAPLPHLARTIGAAWGVLWLVKIVRTFHFREEQRADDITEAEIALAWTRPDLERESQDHPGARVRTPPSPTEPGSLSWAGLTVTP